MADPVIETYVHTLNAGDFQATADLFVDDGVLYAPFTDPIEGREAIAHYLSVEARGMQLFPEAVQEGPSTEETRDARAGSGGDRQYELLGKVQTSMFTVNVSWLFHLSADSRIRSVRVKLLASLKQLLPLKPPDQ